MNYYTDPMAALDAAVAFLRGNTRPHALIGQTPKGFRVIDPRGKKQYYCQIVGKVYRKLS